MRRLLLMLAILASVVPAGAQRHTHHRHTTHHRVHHAVRQSLTVWVNTASGVYHYRGMRWYGNTRQGEYMSEDRARAAGYRPTMNGQ